MCLSFSISCFSGFNVKAGSSTLIVHVLHIVDISGKKILILEIKTRYRFASLIATGML